MSQLSEPDLKGLSREFVLKVMAKCIEDHDQMHCYDHCEDAIICDADNCLEYRWEEVDDWEKVLESSSEVFVHSPFSDRHHKLGPESCTIIEVKGPEVPSDKTYGCTHTIEMCYTNGTKHEWHATYGVNEQEGVISLWAD